MRRGRQRVSLRLRGRVTAVAAAAGGGGPPKPAVQRARTVPPALRLARSESAESAVRTNPMDGFYSDWPEFLLLAASDRFFKFVQVSSSFRHLIDCIGSIRMQKQFRSSFSDNPFTLSDSDDESDPRAGWPARSDRPGGEC